MVQARPAGRQLFGVCPGSPRADAQVPRRFVGMLGARFSGGKTQAASAATGFRTVQLMVGMSAVGAPFTKQVQAPVAPSHGRGSCFRRDNSP